MSAAPQHHLLPHVEVVIVDSAKHRDQQRNEDENNPGAVGELALDHHEQDEPRGYCPKAIDGGLRAPAALPGLLPVAHHAGLRQGEGEKNAHGIEGNQAMRPPAEEHNQERRQEG